MTGFEPVTLRLSSVCSNQLSYMGKKIGTPIENRTQVFAVKGQCPNR